MAIKIGNIDISAFKVGSDDCKVYLGETLVYSGGTTPTSPKLIAYLSGGTTESISYDGSNCLTSGETRNVNDRGSVTSATVSDYITCIDENTFGGRGSRFTAFIYIEEITFLSTTPPTCTYQYFSHPFYSLSYLTKIYVPAESVDAYKAEWSECSSLIQAIPNS